MSSVERITPDKLYLWNYAQNYHDGVKLVPAPTVRAEISKKHFTESFGRLNVYDLDGIRVDFVASYPSPSSKH